MPSDISHVVDIAHDMLLQPRWDYTHNTRVVGKFKIPSMDFEGARKASEQTEWAVIITFVLGLMMLPFSWIIYL